MFFLIDWIAKLIWGEEAVEKSRQRKVPADGEDRTFHYNTHKEI
jgi:hypothetical protein